RLRPEILRAGTGCRPGSAAKCSGSFASKLAGRFESALRGQQAKTRDTARMDAAGTAADPNMSTVNYPAEWKRVAHTLDGVEYGIRPIRADDLLRDKDFIMGLSPESRYTRMFAVMREPSAALLEQFVH